MRGLRESVGRLLWGPPTRGHSLALAIPARDDAAALARLLDQARAMGIFAQIVVVDDGSDPPLAVPPGIELLRNRRPQGGGAARNRALRALRTDYVLFFDADDSLTPDLPLLLEDLAGAGEFDLCLFKHVDSRVLAEGIWGQPDWDERFWEEADLALGALTEAPPAGWPILAQTANYPWNKILRTRFLRRHRIRCATTQVHNDLPLHWLAFIHARRVLTSDRVCALHRVAPRAGRLTNQRGAARLEVFRALAPVWRAVRHRPAWRAAMLRFVPGLFDWIEALIDPDLKAPFRRRAAAWLARAGGDRPRAPGAGG